MQHAWKYVIKAAHHLHQQGKTTLTVQELLDESLRLGWPNNPSTIRTHISEHMRADRPAAHHPYLDRLARNTYQLNDAGKRAVQGL